MKLTDLQEEWKADAEIDTLNLGNSSARVPLLHAKWLEKLNSAKLQLRMAAGKYIRLRRDKARWYNGEMSKDELDERGWQQYQGLKPMKSAMNETLQCDEDLIIQEDRVVYLETMVCFLESVVKSINSRTWDIKNSIEWAKLQAGN